ncbi:MAG: hypothetical protein R6W86_06285 [Marinobacter sp.]|uniref:hypothetical protein n=1 Tax=Marinobacter sp. TaxID=50741 RepID=UPI00396E5EF2
MIRAIAVTGLIIGLVALLVFGPRFLSSPVSDEVSRADLPRCDLLERDCQWEGEEGTWLVELEPLGEGDQGTEFQVTVNAPEAPDRFLAVLRGESMYMGEYPIPLKHQGGETWTARFTAPFCTTGSEMEWRIELQSAEEPVGGNPMKLTFWAR